MPQSRKEQDEQDRALIREAAIELRLMGKPVLAQAVDKTLTVDHLALLKRGAWSSVGDENPNLPIYMREVERDHIKAAVEASRKQDPNASNLAQLAEEALTKFLAGEFEPERAERGLPGVKKNLNIRVNADLRRRADEHGKELAGDLGWKPSASNVIKAYLLHLFPMPE